MNDKPKHTPGPWKVVITDYEGRTKRYEVMQAGWSKVICNVHKKGRANAYNYELPVEDNARLIAAAPDLLATLKEIYPVLVSFQLDAAALTVRAAIERAEG